MGEYKAAGGGTVVYFDCFSGISGDMILGALLDLGLDQDQFKEMLASLKLPGYVLEIEKVNKREISATKVLVKTGGAEPVSRNLSDILAIINQSGLPEEVKENSSLVFQHLAKAESKVHGTTMEKVHFHEVGAVDALVDIVGTAAALYLLGADQVSCSPLPLGRGEVQSAHGKLPLPAPATLALIAERKVPVYGVDADFELVTPTGAATMAALAFSFGLFPAMCPEKVGYGAGSHDPGYPNCLRVVSGRLNFDVSEHHENISLIEANIDDLNPEIYGYLMERLFEAGAADVFFTPIHMKKNRPAVQLSVISPLSLVKELKNIIFAETTTLGLRVSTASKMMCLRETRTVQTEWGPVRVKYIPTQKGEDPLQYAPEYEDCRNIAKKAGRPLKEIYRIVEEIFRNNYA